MSEPIPKEKRAFGWIYCSACPYHRSMFANPGEGRNFHRIGQGRELKVLCDDCFKKDKQ